MHPRNTVPPAVVLGFSTYTGPGDAMLKRIGSAATALIVGLSVAHAADIPRPVYKAPVAVPAQFSWTGFYVGAHAGAAFGRADTTSYNGDLFPPFLTTPPGAVPLLVLGLAGVLPGSGARNTSWLAGGQVGYNWQVDSFVFGVEADGSATGLRMTGTSTNTRFAGTPVAQTVTLSTTSDVDWMASFRGRLGYAAGRALFYVTGGAAIADIDVTNAVTLVNGPGIALPAGAFATATTGSVRRLGWTAGGGIEWAFADAWSVAGEYRHSDFGRVSTAFTIPDGLGTVFATGTNTTRVSVDQATVRLNYRFGTGPVVARY